MLKVIDIIGGVLLVIFLASTRGWSQISGPARRMRLSVGGLFLGFVAGTVLYKYFPGAFWFSDDRSTRAWAAFAGLPLVLLAITFFLESLSKRLNADCSR
jgi:hypothetical protein